MLADQLPAVVVVAADRHPGLSRQHGAPPHETRALLHQRVQLVLVGQVIAVAEQDQAVGAHGVLVVGVPVVGQLLERHQQVLAVTRAGAGDRAEHRQEKRVDVRVVRRGVLEQQQRERSRALRAQAGGVPVDLVVELQRHRLDALAGLGVDQRTAAQHPRHRGLRHPGPVGDIDRGGLALLAHGVVYRRRGQCPSLDRRVVARMTSPDIVFNRADHRRAQNTQQSRRVAVDDRLTASR